MKSASTDKPSSFRLRRAKASTRTLGFQLLAAMNLTVGVLVALFLVHDYRRDMTNRLAEKHTALQEEAKTLLPAILQMREYNESNIQGYVDAVCKRMRDSQSPGHHIAVKFGGRTLQASAHHRASAEILDAMRRAAHSTTYRARFGNTELVVGETSQDGVTVYVSETLRNLRRSVMGDVLRRILGVAVLSVVAALVINVVLWRVVARPIKQLVVTVQEIADGGLGIQSKALPSVELNFLASEINAMSESLAAASRNREAQMAKARDIQRNLLPGDICPEGLDVAHVFEPADDVGGDYYDALRLHDGSWLFAVADVTGHGVPAAMSASMLKVLLMQAAERLTSPADIMSFINERFTSVSLVGDFASMVLVRTAPRDEILDYASAGHEPSWLLSSTGGLRELQSTGTLLGIDPESNWKSVSIRLEPGERLLIATDGVSETVNPKGSQFGRRRLVQLFADCSQDTLQHVARRIRDTVCEYRHDRPQHDDLTVVLLERTGPQ